MKEKGMTTITLKKINREKVYQYIYQQKETSKLQIVQDLQMGLSTVSQNLNELENDGLISRNGYFESTGGRKAQIIRFPYFDRTWDFKRYVSYCSREFIWKCSCNRDN